MKMQEAMKIINARPYGYMVSFERVCDCLVEVDHFPDVTNGEDPIRSLDEAWEHARLFAEKASPQYRNIYVIHENGFRPVHDYLSMAFRKR